MRITRLETIPIRVPLHPELAIRSGRGGAHTTSPFLLIKVHTDEGIVGLGEVSCTPRWSGEDQFTAQHLIRTYLEPLLVGENPLAVESLAARFRLAFGANPFAKAGVEMALWDIAGKAARQPVCELLGGKVREVVPTKWSVSGVEPEKAAEIARWAVAQGFGAMKIKVGTGPADDIARVGAVRAAIGPAIKLGVDANGGWSLDQAVEATRRLREFAIAFVEQPVTPEELVRRPELRAKLGLPLIADESVWSLQDAITLARLGAADVFSVYVGKAGGIAAARGIAEFARGAGIECTVGSNLELGIGSAAMAQLASATRGIAAETFPCDIIGPLFYADDIVRDTSWLEPGAVRAPAGPGLGVELDDEKVERYRVR